MPNKYNYIFRFLLIIFIMRTDMSYVTLLPSSDFTI